MNLTEKKLRQRKLGATNFVSVGVLLSGLFGQCQSLDGEFANFRLSLRPALSGRQLDYSTQRRLMVAISAVGSTDGRTTVRQQTLCRYLAVDVRLTTLSLLTTSCNIQGCLAQRRTAAAAGEGFSFIHTTASSPFSMLTSKQESCPIARKPRKKKSFRFKVRRHSLQEPSSESQASELQPYRRKTEFNVK